MEYGEPYLGKPKLGDHKLEGAKVMVSSCKETPS